jgi:hypothetical protein
LAGQSLEKAMKGMPHLYYALGDSSHPTWISRTLIAGEHPQDVRRLYQREDALPLPPDPEPVARAPRHLNIRRIFGATSG